MKSWEEMAQHITSIPQERKLEIEVAAYFAESIVARRKQLKLTQAELGAKVNMSQSQIAQVENSTTVPRLDTLIAIANALGLQVTLVEKEQAATTVTF
ncbi:helix-turn-helix domain-containing protein [Alkalihalobacillus oceani]|uniref:Helix-turn-helix domain-containing protein n=1 Tax=Halalkalibacter oceani TaxID=1653776 RepID=A0A9X2DS80_9BACI|nr:helix-turn-helix transcriptional regulator [Halalkalibacter oceani]MCM3714640.1 helix-turn-helix domain-containing protein [Halalkalibacter oceani]